MINVILPTYNAEKTIKDSIDSIINQTYAKWELIVIDNCSIDNTEHLVKSYKDERIKYVKNEVNLKVAKTINKSIKKAKHNYIAFLYSYVLWMPI